MDDLNVATQLVRDATNDFVSGDRPRQHLAAILSNALTTCGVSLSVVSPPDLSGLRIWMADDLARGLLASFERHGGSVDGSPLKELVTGDGPYGLDKVALASIVADEFRPSLTPVWAAALWPTWSLWSAVVWSSYVLEAPGDDGGLAKLSPIEEEIQEFERLWRVVELAMESGSFPQELEREMRALQKMLNVLRRDLDPVDHQDLFDLISLKLRARLPDVLACLPPAAQLPASMALTHSATIDDQLRALATDVESASSSLLSALPSLTQESKAGDAPGPVLQAALNKADRLTDRLSQSFAIVDEIERKLRSTRSGRRVVSGAAAIGAGTAAAIGAGLSPEISAASAFVAATVGSWLYARLRRGLPSLPPRRPARGARGPGRTD